GPEPAGGRGGPAPVQRRRAGGAGTGRRGCQRAGACLPHPTARTGAGGGVDLARREWWPEALEWSGVPPSLLPDLVVAGHPLGRVTRPDAPARLAGAVLTLAGGDPHAGGGGARAGGARTRAGQAPQAAAVGAGAAGPGDLLDSCGTAEALIRTARPGLPGAAGRELTAAGVTVGWHALPGRWCLLGATEGGLVLERTLRLLGLASAAIPDLDQRALSAPPEASPGATWRDATEAVTRQVAELGAV